MSRSITQLAGVIANIRNKHAVALRAELQRLRATFGVEAINAAVRLADEKMLRATLAIDGQRARVKTATDAAKTLAEEVFGKGRP